MNIYIPSNFVFENYFPDCTKHRDKYFYFIHKIYEEKLFDSRYEKDSYIKLHGRTLRSIIGERLYYPLRENLVSKGIIEINHNYCINEFSKSYRLTKPFRYEKHKQIMVTDENILQRIYRRKQKLIKDIPEGIEYNFLYSNLLKVRIDYLKANAFINENCFNDPDKYNSYKISIDYLKESNFYFTVDNVAGRVHTNITNLPKELRKFLSYIGKQLVKIDISNSQPFLFNILIYNYFSFNQPTTNTHISYINTTKLYTSPYVVTFPNDVMKYISLTSEGAFYEYLMEKGKIGKENRQKFKKDFFGKIFFCKNSKRLYKEAKLFKELFPNVYRVIRHYKKEDYRQLAINLQQAEANIIINKICNRIANERPDIFICTIHDSILTTKENKSYICNVILNEFENNFNLKPSIKIEDN